MPRPVDESDARAQALRAHVVIGALLIGGVLLAFSPALYAGFVAQDDPETVVNNPHIRALTPGNLRAMFTTFTLGHYQPLALLTLALDHAAWGDDPRGYHLTSILIHALNGVLLYVVALRVLGLGFGRTPHPPTTATTPISPAALRTAAALAAAFYALHPLRVESVAWVTERRDVLSLLWLLAATLAYLSYAGGARAGRRRTGAYAACVLFLALSLLSKAWGMSFFVVLLILDWYPLRRLPGSPREWAASTRVLAEKLPMLLLGLTAAGVASVAVRHSLATKPLEEWGVLARLVQAVYGLWFYLLKTAIPTDLAPLYEIPSRLDALEPRFIAAYLGVGVLAVVLVLAARRAPAVLAAFAAYAVTVAPVLGVLQSGDQLVADRYAYVATIPIVLLLAAGGLAAARRLASPARAGVLAAALVLVFSFLTWKQSDVWHDTETLWRHAVRVTDGAVACEFLGNELDQQGRTDEAVKAYEEALARDPANGQAMYYLANAHARSGRPAEAARAYAEAARHMRQPYVAHLTLALLYANALNQPADAEASFKAAVASVERAPRPRPGERGMTYIGYALFLKRQGRTPEARDWLLKALDDPDARAAAEHELKALPGA